MEGNAELLRLAELLLIGAEATRKIADARVLDREELYAITVRAKQMAAELRWICERADAAGHLAN